MDSKQKYDTRIDAGSSKVLPIVTPEWQPFPGFSFLFDNPGKSLAEKQEYAEIAVNVESDPALAMYKNIAEATRDIFTAEDLVNRFMFFPLPSNTYHVTVWDGVSAGVLDALNAEAKRDFRSCFASPPESVIECWPPMPEQVQLENVFDDLRPIRLRYKDLRARGYTVLVVELEPADSESEVQLELLLRKRDQLDDAFEKLGKPKNHDYKPHVAVGYFSDQSRGDAAIRQFMDSWIKTFDQTVSGSVIEFPSISLYAFTDMITYIKRS